MLLSADTFYSTVAREAVAAGADIVNDVSGGLMDDYMFATVQSSHSMLFRLVVQTLELPRWIIIGRMNQQIPCH